MEKHHIVPFKNIQLEIGELISPGVISVSSDKWTLFVMGFPSNSTLDDKGQPVSGFSLSRNI